MLGAELVGRRRRGGRASRRPGAGEPRPATAPAEFDDEAQRRSTRTEWFNRSRRRGRSGSPIPASPARSRRTRSSRFFAAPGAPSPLPSFRAVFEAVRDGEADAGVVPVESSLLGTIRENLDLLCAFDLPIVGEVVVPGPARAARAAGRDARRPSSASTRSRPRSPRRTSSCGSRPWSVQTTYNTAGAAKQIAERGERGAAAVASARVAAIYGLEVIADDIQTGADNRTRFAVDRAARRRGGVRAAARARGGRRARRGRRWSSRCATCRARSIGRSARSPSRGINLSRLESRPWTGRGSRWEYLFWVDLDADPAEPRVRRGPRRARARDGGRPDPGHATRAPPRTDASDDRPRSGGDRAAVPIMGADA